MIKSALSEKTIRFQTPSVKSVWHHCPYIENHIEKRKTASEGDSYSFFCSNTRQLLPSFRVPKWVAPKSLDIGTTVSRESGLSIRIDTTSPGTASPIAFSVFNWGPGQGYTADCVHFLRYVNNRPVLERNQTRLHSIGDGGGRTLLEEPHLILPDCCG